jgi:cell division protease FtsH
MMTDVSDIPSPSSIIQPFLNQPIGVQYTYSDFIEKLQNKYIESITFFNDGKTAIVADTDHTNALHPDNLHYVHILPNSYTYIMDIANKFHVHVDMKDVPVNFLNSIMGFVGQSAMYIGGYFLLMAILRSFMGGNGNMGNMLPGGLSNKNSGQLVDGSNLNVSFADVAGCDEAKFELVEIVDFLKSPTKYNDAGAKVPKGVLLEGSPGTGKTLLAKAVAAEANVPFLSASGSEFIEMFVGVGAARVRSLFEKAKENAPCVIFIDEIDAIGRQRGAGVAGGNDEREQTLNQILTNMDGFEENSGIVVLAATNRLDVLDSALIRPGRFDRKIKVTLPDFEGRKQIAGVHFRNKKIDKELDFNELSSLTTGFSGADIANLANEAAIFSVRNNQTQIDRTTLLDAYEKITIGLNSNVQENDKTVVNLVSYHETGHALMTCLFPQFFDLRKVTINANKNGAGGYTLFTPKERYTKYATKKFLLANLIIALGGRAAEVYLNSNTYKTNVFDNHVFKGIRDLDITTGASNDLLQANRIAKDYITKYGFGDLFGLCEDCNNDQPFMGKELGSPRSRLSDNIRKDIDTQVAQLVEFAYKSALELIQLNEVSFMEIVDLLAKERIIEGEDIMKILEKNSEVVSFD